MSTSYTITFTGPDVADGFGTDVAIKDGILAALAAAGVSPVEEFSLVSDRPESKIAVDADSGS